MRRIQKLPGHHGVSTTGRIYAYHSPGYLTRAVGLIEAVIEAKAAIEPEAKAKVCERGDECITTGAFHYGYRHLQ